MFQLKPFQKNIGCGTYRIWRDLSSEPDWFSIWRQSPQTKALIVEGYPSLSWKILFQLKNRDLNALTLVLPQSFKEIALPLSLTADQADAMVLALHSFTLFTSPASRKKQLALADSKEGWIMGLQL